MPRPSSQAQGHDEQADRDGDERKAPDEQVESRTARRQEDPLAVARDKVFAHLRRCLAGFQALAHDRSHLPGHLRWRVGDRKVLAHDTPQVRRNVVDRLLGDVRGRGRHDEHRP